MVSPPASGKSSQLFQVIKELDVAVLYTSSLVDLNEQAREWCDDLELTTKVLPTMSNDCISWEDESVRRAHARGAYAREIHERGVCSEGQDCPYIQKIPAIAGERGSGNEHVPRSEGQVLIGHPVHSRVFPYINGRVVIYDDVDETDAFLEEYDDIGRTCQAYLQDDRFPADTPEQLYRLRENEPKRHQALDLLDEIASDPFDEGNTHRNAPAVIRTILEHTPLNNGFGYYSGPPAERFWGVADGNHGVHLLAYPDLRASQVVIGLDAYPMLFTDDELPVWWWMWTGLKLHPERILSDSETETFIEDVLGMTVIQTSDRAKPYSSGKWVTVEKDRKLLDFIAKSSDRAVIPVVSTKQALDQLDVDVSLNFNQIKSRNDFAEYEIGAVIGSPHPGDTHFQLLAAFMNQSIEGEGKGMEREYGEVGNTILQKYRESMVAQAILRFGRHPSVESSTVYVHTAAIPDSIPAVEKTPEEADGFASCESQVRIVLEDKDEPLTINEITDQTSCSYESVRRVLSMLEVRGVVEQHEPSGGLHNLTDDVDKSQANSWVLCI